MSRQYWVRSKSKNTLRDAIRKDDVETTKNSIKLISIINDIDYLFLHKACENENTEIVDLLLDNVAKCDFENRNGEIPLHIACFWHEENEIVEILLKRGSIDLINKQNNQGCTPLHIACYCGKKEVVEMLLKYGASLTIQDEWEKSPLRYARRNGFCDIVEIIEEEEERRRNVGNVGCHLLRATRAICGFNNINIPPEIRRVVLSFFDEDRVLSEKQVKDVIDFGFDFTSLPD